MLHIHTATSEDFEPIWPAWKEAGFVQILIIPNDFPVHTHSDYVFLVRVK